jgi:hypothetical protein
MSSVLDSKTMAGRFSLVLALAALSVGCSDPCEDYCEAFVDKTQECGLGGPSGDDAISDCGDQLGEVFSDDACETANDEISSMSCDEFVPQVCSQSDASSIYNCD